MKYLINVINETYNNLKFIELKTTLMEKFYINREIKLFNILLNNF